ncbi:MAG TPA: histidine kinase dimerization/phospho-acceptor domain-containing protein, partial [Reyranellaceae bacterium]|nr:histidine kinase dimerization/phospho-acceptor domain-containing protein [Reyranellaceae bacterium]
RWECGPSGEIAWVEGAPRGALIGRSIARAEDEEGVDDHVERAFAMRAPFRDATLRLGGESLLAGEWKISGIPAFEPADGRFAGYRGVAMRETAGAVAANGVVVEAHAPLDPDTLRELVHEIKTPLNAIIGFAEIIDGQYLGPADRRYRRRAAEIVAQARLLLAAIDDLDLAAKLRSDRERPGAGTGLVELLQALEPELRAEAEARGAVLELAANGAGGRCAIEPALATRLIRRFCGALIGVAAAGERIRLSAQHSGEQCLLTVGRPAAIAGASEDALLDPAFGSDAATGGLGVGFSLRLVRGLARIAGGYLLVAVDRLTLALPGAENG